MAEIMAVRVCLLHHEALLSCHIQEYHVRPFYNVTYDSAHHQTKAMPSSSLHSVSHTASNLVAAALYVAMSQATQRTTLVPLVALRLNPIGFNWHVKPGGKAGSLAPPTPAFSGALAPFFLGPEYDIQQRSTSLQAQTLNFSTIAVLVAHQEAPMSEWLYKYSLLYANHLANFLPPEYNFNVSCTTCCDQMVKYGGNRACITECISIGCGKHSHLRAYLF
jgi:hypothetical protein